MYRVEHPSVLNNSAPGTKEDALLLLLKSTAINNGLGLPIIAQGGCGQYLLVSLCNFPVSPILGAALLPAETAAQRLAAALGLLGRGSSAAEVHVA